MEAVAILRQLWRRRLLVAVGLALALVIGIVMVYRVTLGFPPRFESRQYKVGIASAEVLVDSPSSQVVDLSGGKVATDVNTLTGRARLLANLMATSPLKDQIARRAGIDPRSLTASVPTLNGPAPAPSPLTSGTKSPRANILTVSFQEELPIITAAGQASNPETAARISSAAVSELGVYLTSVAANQKVPYASQLVISRLGPARSATVVRGPGRNLSVVAALVFFALWCAGIVVGSRLARDWRQAAADEELDDSGEPGSGAREPQPASPWPERYGTAAPDPPPAHASALWEAPAVQKLPDLPDLPERPERPQRRGMVA
jgi:hypothetical protein